MKRESILDDLRRPLPSRLPLRCPSVAGESLVSFVVRLAEFNRTEPEPLVRAVFRSYPPLAVDDEEVARFAAMSGLPKTQVRSLCPERRHGTAPRGRRRERTVFMGHELRGGDFDRRRRVCPGCLVDSPHDRLIWSVKALGGCMAHDRPFVENCSACGRPLDWVRTISRCACGQALDQLVALAWNVGERELTAYVGGRLTGVEPAGIARLDQLALHDALALMSWVGALVPHPDRQPSGRDLIVRGFEALAGPRDWLFQIVRGWAGMLPSLGEGRVGAGRLQPELPGFEKAGEEAIAELIREAAAG